MLSSYCVPDLEFDTRGSVTEEPVFSQQFIKQLREIVNVYISFRSPTHFEGLTDEQLLSLTIMKVTANDMAKGFAECILRSVFDGNDDVLSNLKKRVTNEKFLRLISGLELECRRIKKRSTIVTIPTTKPMDEKKSQQDTLFDAGLMYEEIYAPYEPGKDKVFKTDHLSLTLNELAGSHKEMQRLLGLEVHLCEKGPQKNTSYLITEPTLDTDAAVDFLGMECAEEKLNQQKLIRLSWLNQNVPILIKQKYKNGSEKLFIFGPKKVGKERIVKQDELMNPANWDLSELAVDPSVLTTKSEPEIRKEFEIKPSLLSEIVKVLDISYMVKAKNIQAKANGFYHYKLLIASPGMSGIVHGYALARRIKDAKLLASQGQLLYLKRSQQLYLLEVDLKSKVVGGFSYYLKGNEIRDFAQRSTMNDVFNRLQPLAKIAFAFSNFTMDNFDREAGWFKSSRLYTNSTLRVERTLSPAHTNTLFGAVSRLLEENHIIKNPEFKKQDCFSNQDAIQKWSIMRHDPDALKKAVEKTVYIFSGLQQQEVQGRFWVSTTDKESVGLCFLVADQVGIALDPNHIPDEFNETKMTPVMLAANKRDFDLVKKLVELKADIEPAREAIKKGDLLVEGDLEAYFKDKDVISLNAATHNHIEILKREMKKPESRARMGNVLKQAAAHGHNTLIKTLLVGVDSYHFFDMILNGAAYYGLKQYNYWQQQELNGEISLPRHLCSAICAGHLTLVKQILSMLPKGVAAVLLEPAILVALQYKRQNVLSYLLRYAKDNRKNTAAIINAKDMLHQCVLDVDMLKIFLEYRPDLNRLGDSKECLSQTPAFSAALLDKVKVVEILIVNGADFRKPCQYNGKQISLIELIFEKYNKRIMEVMVKHLNDDDMLSVIRGLTSSHPVKEVIHFLLKSGLDPNRTFKDKTLLDIAKETADAPLGSIAFMLTRYGASVFIRHSLFASSREVSISDSVNVNASLVRSAPTTKCSASGS